MKIIILGAGQVGSSLAISLANEAHDITLVDADPQILQDIQGRADLRTVTGKASHPGLAGAGRRSGTDMIIALTEKR